MTDKTFYPKNTNQVASEIYAMWTSIHYITNNSSKRAITYDIESVGHTNRRPSPITVSNFKCNIPNNARVRKITVEYHHKKFGYYSPLAPSGTSNPAFKIGAPTITVSNGSKKLFSGKGQAPTDSFKSQSYSKTGDWTASTVNSNNFKVELNYPENKSKATGKLYLSYIRVKITYVTPSYSIQAEKVGTGYNKEDFKAVFRINNVNNTEGNPSVTITTPTGFSYNGWGGNGKIQMISANTFVWNPELKHGVGSRAVYLDLKPNVTYPSGSSSYPYQFVASISGYGSTTLNGYITDAPVKKDETGENPQSFETDTDIPDVTIKDITVDEEFEYTFQLSETALNELQHKIYDYGIEQGWWTGTFEEEYDNIMNGWIRFDSGSGNRFYLSKNRLIESYKSSLWADTYVKTTLSSLADNSATLTLKGVGVGYDEIYLWAYAKHPTESGAHEISSFEYLWKFNIRPKESDLSTPYLTLLTPSEEETHRLGTGYPYTVQSYLNVHGKTIFYEEDGEQSFTISESSDPHNRILATIPESPQTFRLNFKMKLTAANFGFGICKSDEYDASANWQKYLLFFRYLVNEMRCGYIEGDTSTRTHQSAGDIDFNTYSDFSIVRDADTISFYQDDTECFSTTLSWLDGSYNLILFGTSSGTVTVKDMSFTEGEGDSYVRDWYKNFRIGVFNNRIEANCTDYVNFDTNFTTQEREITYYTNDLTGCTLTLTVDKALDVTIDETLTHLTSSNPLTLSNLEGYIQVAQFDKVNDNNVILTATLRDSNNTILQQNLYKVNFNCEAEVAPYESTDDTTDYTTLTTEQICNNAKYWGNCPSNVNTYDNIETEFTYNENYPLHLLICADYPEATNIANVKFTEPCIVEHSAYTGWEPNGNFPLNINDVINNETIASISIKAYETTNGFIIYNLPLMDGYGTDEEIAIRGIELTGNIEQSDSIVLNAKLKAPTGATGNRSLIINEYEGNNNNDPSFRLGGNGDLWGFTTLDMVELDDWQIELSYSNPLNDAEAQIAFNNLQLTLYIEPVQKAGIQVKIEDEDTRYYGAFLQDLDIPFGLKTDTDFLNIDGTDTNDAYRQNIREKTIGLTFEIGDTCDIEANTLSLRQLTQLILNEKDKYNRPIPKRIWFSHLSDLYAEYICEDVFDTEIDINTYQIKAKLVIPAGCFYTLDSTRTSSIGYVQGVASINPIITIKPSDANITVTEKNSNQKFVIRLPSIDTADTTYSEQPIYNTGVIEIDCEDQEATWTPTNNEDTEININKYVDFNSDWFSLKDEYNFECAGAILQIVDYEERW